jgi:hypothetical protein
MRRAQRPVIPTVPLPCPIQVAPTTADAAWSTAASEAASHLAAARAADTDCQSIRLEVRGSGAVLSVVTSNGRRAVRPVAAPAELGPLLEALVTTVAIDGAAAPAPASSETARVSPAADAGSSAARPGASRGSWWFVGLSGGGRLGLADWVGASPTAQLSVGALFGAWESGIAGSSDFAYGRFAGAQPGGFTLRTYDVEAFVGYRPRVGPVLLAVGINGGAAFVDESVFGPSYTDQGTGGPTSMDTVVPAGTRHYRPVQAELGAYLGVVVPIGRILRIRSQIGVRGVAARSATAPSVASFPSLPNWDGALSVGVEGGAP